MLCHRGADMLRTNRIVPFESVNRLPKVEEGDADREFGLTPRPLITEDRRHVALLLNVDLDKGL